MLKTKIYIIFFLIFLLFALNIFFFTDLNFIEKTIFIYEGVGLIKASIYVISVFFALLSLALLFFIHNKLLYTLALIFILLSYAINFIYFDINNATINSTDINIITQEADNFALAALSTFSDSILQAMFPTIILFFIFFFIRKMIHKHNLYTSKKIIFPIFIVAIIGIYIIVDATEYGINEYPSPIKITETVLYNMTNKKYYGLRDVLNKVPKNVKKYNNIIWIIDESVGGRYLSINGYNKKTTPYLKELKNNILNLGIASSGANRSGLSNLILMSGIQPKQLPDLENISLKNPSIFQYAKNAGFSTAYISGQSHNHKLQNFITEYDLNHIDTFYQPTNENKEILDQVPEKYIIDYVSKVLKEHKSNFIYIVKAGAHFPYEHAYPKEQKIFHPTLNKNESMHGKKEKSINSYLNAIRWKVDEFFRHFFKATNILERDDTLIIYTSDHGQSILENGVLTTHSTAKNPPKTQGIVPLILFAKNTETIKRDFMHIKNKATHFMLFPTTLKLMGYEEDNAETLFDKKIKQKQIFISGHFFEKNNFNQTSIGK